MHRAESLPFRDPRALSCQSLTVDNTVAQPIVRLGTYGRSAWELVRPLGPVLIVRTGPGFGDQVLAQSQRSLNRYNPGGADLNVTSINPTDGAFKLKPLPAFPFPIPAGRSHTVRIEFEPPAPGHHRGTFTIATDIPGSSPTKVRVSGTSVAAGRARLSARAPLRFGFVEVGDTVRLPITIRNTGTKPMTVSAIDLDPKGSQAMTIVRLTPLGTIPQAAILLRKPSGEVSTSRQTSVGYTVG